jgi:hypothetical protein
MAAMKHEPRTFQLPSQAEREARERQGRASEPKPPRGPTPEVAPSAQILDMGHIQQLKLTQPKEVIEELVTPPGL